MEVLPKKADDAFKLRDRITVSEWAERHRVVSEGPRKGRWSNRHTPYLVEPMDTWGLPWIQKVILCFSPQSGKTQVAFNCLMYAIDRDPGSSMYVMPDEKVAKRISRRRIIPGFKNTPRIAALLSSRHSEVSTHRVKFTNGMDLILAWATSASELASESVRYLFFDETDKYVKFTGKEADPISLGELRTLAYPYTRKILYLSTPRTEDDTMSNLMNYEADEIRKYEAQCPFCGYFQIMEFTDQERFHWPRSIKDPRIIQRKRLCRYSCINCGMDWDDHHRDKAVRAGRWMSDRVIKRPQAVAFHLPAWYSPFVSLSDVAAAFIRGLDDISKHMVFISQFKAEPWKQVVESKDDSEILAHKTDNPPGVVPNSALVLTCGIDVQKVGFWHVVRAWEEDLTSHLIQYGFLPSFEAVEQVLSTAFQYSDGNGSAPIWRAAIDTGGGFGSESTEWTRTEEIYQWLRSQQPGQVFGIKGASRPQFNRIRPTLLEKMARGKRPIPGGLIIYLLNTVQLKETIHWRLTRKEGETQRFYLHSETGIDYSRQITAEVKYRTKAGKFVWKQIRSDNHLLDAEVYAAAAADPEWLPNAQSIIQRFGGNRLVFNNPSALPLEKQTGRRVRSKGLSS